MGALQICGGCVIFLGIVVLIAGIVVGGMLTTILDEGLKKVVKDEVYICPGDAAGSKGWDRFAAVNYLEDWDAEDATLQFDSYYLYHITNAANYLKGTEVAKVVEVGPFVIKGWDQSYDMSVDATGITYRYTSAHVFLDGDQTFTGPGAGGVEETATFESKSPVGISRNTKIANFNLGYLTVLGSAGTEYALYLTGAGCTADQIMNVASPSASVCTDNELGNGTSTCKCCTLPDQILMADYAGLGKAKEICDGLSDSLDDFIINEAVTGLNSGTAVAPDSAAFATHYTTIATQATAAGISVLQQATNLVIIGLGCAAPYSSSPGSACTSATDLATAHSNIALWSSLPVTVPQNILVKGILASKGAAKCECASGLNMTAAGCCLSAGSIPNTDTLLPSDAFSLEGFFCNSTVVFNKDGDAYPWGTEEQCMDKFGVDDYEFSCKGKGEMTYPFKNAYYYATAAGFAAGAANATVPTERNCADMITESAGITSLVSFLSRIDGGTAVKSTGDTAFDGSTFVATAFGETSFHTPLITEHTANDHLYGYPSALLGAMIPMLVLELPGLPLSQKMGNLTEIGAYTAGFQALCASSCSAPTSATPDGFNCAGNAPSREAIEALNPAALMYADNDCKPLSWTYSTVAFCSAIEDGVTALLNEYCEDGIAETMYDTVAGAGAWAALSETAQATQKAGMATAISDYIAAQATNTSKTTDAWCQTTVLSGFGAQGIIAEGAAVSVSASDSLAGAYYAAIIAQGLATDLTGAAAVYAGMTKAPKAALETAVHIAAVATGLGMANPETQTEDAIVQAYAASEGYEYCTCYDGANGVANMPATGCCLAGGGTPDQDFTGFGCLYGAPGHYESGLSRTSSLDLAESMTRHKAIKDTEATSKAQFCPTNPEDIADQVEYYGETSHVAARNGATQPVQGGNAQFFAPKGLTTKAGDSTVTKPGTNVGDTITLWVKQVLRELPLSYQGDGELHGVTLAKYSPDPKLMWSTADGGIETASADVDVGVMADGTVGFNGAQHVGVASGTGLPVFLMQPNFLNCDPDLLDSTVNDLEIYNYVDYTVEDPSTITAPVTSGTWDLNACTLVDQTFIDDNLDSLNVDVLVEPALGLAFAGYKRLSLATSPVTACNPLVDPTCALSLNRDGANGACYGAVADAFWDGTVIEFAPGGATTLSGKQLLGAAMVAGGKTYAPGYACSQANVLTPNFKGGNLMPVYWADQATAASEKSMKDFKVLGDVVALSATISIIGIAVGVVFIILGGVCIAMGGKSGKVTAAA